MMNTNIQIFKSKDFGEIRTCQVNNQIMFVGKDVAAALGYKNVNKALADHVDVDDLTKRYPIIDNLGGQYKRYCIRNVLRSWFGHKATDDFIWEVCYRCAQEGLRELLPPALSPRKHRELLRAIISASLGISMCKVNLKALDSAYTIAFPHSTPLNVNKKKRQKPP